MDAKEYQEETADSLNVPPKEVSYITDNLVKEYEEKSAEANTAEGDSQGGRDQREPGGQRVKWGTYGNSLMFSRGPDAKIYWKQGPKGTSGYGSGTGELRNIARNLVTHVKFKGSGADGQKWYFIGNYNEAEGADLLPKSFINFISKPFNDQSRFSRFLVFGVISLIGGILWYFLTSIFNQSGGLADAGFVRGWITLLICFATIAFGIGIVTSALRMAQKDEGFRYSREVFGSFTAVLATIVGFYFGSETRNADPAAAALAASGVAAIAAGASTDAKAAYETRASEAKNAVDEAAKAAKAVSDANEEVKQNKEEKRKDDLQKALQKAQEAQKAADDRVITTAAAAAAAKAFADTKATEANIAADKAAAAKAAAEKK